MRFKIALLLFIAFSYEINAQIIYNSPPKGPLLQDYRTDSTSFPRYRIVNLGIGGQVLRDPLLSALRYYGPFISANVNTLKFRPKFLTNSILSFHLNILHNKATGAKIYETGASYFFSMSKKINPISNDKWLFYAGVSGEAVFNFRLALANVNNVFAYDAMVSLGTTTTVQRNFTLFKRNFSISNQINIPFINIVSRPGYSWSYPSFTEEGGKLKDDIEIGSMGKYFKIQNKFMLDFELGTRHKHKKIGKTAWRLTYQYEYYNINQLNRVQSGTDMIMIGRIHKF